MPLDQIVLDDSHLDELLGNSHQANYIKGYLRHLKVKTCVVENKYIDKDFMIDYQKFYSRSFKKYEKIVKRIHFFSKEFLHEQFHTYLVEYSDEILSDLQDGYLGFVIIKYLVDPLGNPIIGRSLLKTYNESINGRSRRYLKNSHKISLFGLNLKINSIPFQAQDQGVSACATVSLWSALQTISTLYDLTTQSLVEITENATTFPSRGRKFPQQGLTLEQMIIYFRLLKLDTEVLKTIDQPNDEIIITAVKAYLKCGIPIVTLLKLEKIGEPERKPDYHTALITGYQCDRNNEIVELYIHDDQIGPYSRVKPVGDFRVWDNEWRTLGYNARVEYLLIPIYHKIREDFVRMMGVVRSTHNYFSGSDGVNSELLDVSLFLTTVQKYKKYLLKKSINDKTVKLIEPLSRFIWVMSVKYENTLLYDDVYDGTAIYPDKLMRVEYSV